MKLTASKQQSCNKLLLTAPYLFNNQILELKPNIYTANLLNQYIKLKTSLSESPYGVANSLIRNLTYYIVTPNPQLCKINIKN
jgi:hypothetical protein